MTPYLRVANVFDGIIDYSDVLEMNFEPEERVLFFVHPGDILLNEGQSRELVGRSAIYRGDPGRYCFQNTLIRFRVGAHLEPEFAQAQFASWLQAGVFQLFCRQSTNIAHLGADRLAQIHMVVPPLDEQRAIVERIDRETGQIDALVAAKKHLLDLLAEKRKAIIASAVTRGIDPKAKMRDSGVPWLGEIPAHWKVVRAGLAGNILMGRQRAPQYEKGAHIVPYLRVANVLDGFIDYSDVLEMNFEPDEQLLFNVQTGDILLNEGQSRELVGRSAIYRGEPHQYCFQNTIIRFRVGELLCPEFAQAQFVTWLQTGVFQVFSRQSTNIAHLGADRLAQIHMVVPLMNEQKAIIEYIERETAKLDDLRAATERTIALLKERRAALIAAAVTGQIDLALKPECEVRQTCE